MNQLDCQRLAFLLRSRRELDNLSLRDVAKQVGISASTLSRVENGRGDNLLMENFLALCGWLKVSPAGLISNGQPVVESSDTTNPDAPGLWFILAGWKQPQVVARHFGTEEAINRNAPDWARKYGAVIWAVKAEYVTDDLAWPKPGVTETDLRTNVDRLEATDANS